MSQEATRQLNFVKLFIVPEIIKNNEDLQDLLLIDSQVLMSDQLNGFMSNIFMVSLLFEDARKK